MTDTSAQVTPQPIILPTRPFWHRRAQHVHQWTDIAAQYSGPTSNFRSENQSERFILELLRGVTIVTQRCVCGEIAQRRLLGSPKI